ncbi:hypothetical protein ACIPYQ_15545 [Streptomyces sp. NPDC090045]|uniref:hypothetical protein n=1 Tax=Streptomyces sp. NPDC090045 TaxID=3365927 RepID=UPI00380837A0
MGIKDQFQDKAEELRDRAQSGTKGAKDQVTERTAKLQEKAKRRPQQEQADRVRDEFDV